jgi:acetyl-CoA carboxylase beta subunit
LQRFQKKVGVLEAVVNVEGTREHAHHAQRHGIYSFIDDRWVPWLAIMITRSSNATFSTESALVRDFVVLGGARMQEGALSLNADGEDFIGPRYIS